VFEAFSVRLSVRRLVQPSIRRTTRPSVHYTSFCLSQVAQWEHKVEFEVVEQAPGYVDAAARHSMPAPLLYNDIDLAGERCSAARARQAEPGDTVQRETHPEPCEPAALCSPESFETDRPTSSFLAWAAI
jgi:hypothetical protein